MDKIWFPIEGHVILEGNKPIASTPFAEAAHKLIEALTTHNPGMEYTCIGSNGFYSSAVKKEETTPQEDL